jgi:glycosyltransferase involved in cell wall biosynthesis
MRILIIPQKVDKNDSYFGFFHPWLTFFAKECEKVTVIALERHEYDLPENVTVVTLGKEGGVSRIKYFTRFWNYAWQYRNDYDVVFCHMSPLYVITGFPIWKVLGKKISLWYVHRNVDLKLRVAEKLTDIVFSASPESFRINSKKVRYMRQAVDTSQFERPAGISKDSNVFTLVSVGRLTYIKNLDTLIRAAAALIREQGIPVQVKLIGAAVTNEDKECEAKLHAVVAELHAEDIVTFSGSMPFRDICEAYWSADASVNLCPTGGMDKAVLESLASGTPTFLSNEAFRSVLDPYEDQFMFPERDHAALAERLTSFYPRTDKAGISEHLVARIKSDYSLAALIHAIVTALQKKDE